MEAKNFGSDGLISYADAMKLLLLTHEKTLLGNSRYELGKKFFRQDFIFGIHANEQCIAFMCFKSQQAKRTISLHQRLTYFAHQNFAGSALCYCGKFICGASMKTNFDGDHALSFNHGFTTTLIASPLITASIALCTLSSETLWVIKSETLT